MCIVCVWDVVELRNERESETNPIQSPNNAPPDKTLKVKCSIFTINETGASRGFAFVEFNSVQEATRWMDMKKV